MSETELDRKDLKIQALLEKLGEQTQTYENRIADLRVELTISEQNIRNLQDSQAAHYAGNRSPEPEFDIVQGETVVSTPQGV